MRPRQEGDLLMFVDIMGKTKLKIGIVVLSALDKAVYQKEKINQKISELAAEYAREGYDAISVAMPYDYINECEIEGIKILSSCLYTFGDTLEDERKFSVVGFGMDMPPEAQADWRNLQRTPHLKAAEVIRLIQKHNGISVLILPRDCALDEEQIGKMCDADMIDFSGMSDRTYGIFAKNEKYPSLTICNRSMPRASILVESLDFNKNSIVRAIKAGRFYSSTGPEISVNQVAADKIKINCTAVNKISFYSSSSAPAVEVLENNSYVEADYSVRENDKFLIVSVFDENKNFAISSTCLTAKWYEN